jgi:hypothetical protein
MGERGGEGGGKNYYTFINYSTEDQDIRMEKKLITIKWNSR